MITALLRASKTDTKLHVAILHPAKVCIYQILTIDGIADHGNLSCSRFPLTQ